MTTTNKLYFDSANKYTIDTVYKPYKQRSYHGKKRRFGEINKIHKN